MTTETRWMTVKEAAEYTRTDVDWILAHIRGGSLRYVPTARRTVDNAKGPRRRIVDRLKLDSLMEKLEEVTLPPAEQAGDRPKPPAKVVSKEMKAMSFRERFARES